MSADPSAQPQPPGWPQQHTRPQTWPEPPTVPGQQARPPAWPQQPPARPQQAPPPPRARYAVRQRPEEQYWQHYAAGQQPHEWAPPPLPVHDMRAMTVAPKSPAVSVLLSMFIPGLGSMVNDNVGTGVAILVLNIIGWLLAIVLIGIPLAIGTWIWGLVDAHHSAQRWNRAHGIIS